MNSYSLKRGIIIYLWKGCNSYSLVGVLIYKINIFPTKETFYMHITIIKIKNHKK